MNQKPIFLVITLAALLVVVGGAFWFTKKQALAPVVSETPSVSTDTSTVETPSLEPIDTSDWKTYRNDEYGFELKLPSEWSLEETTPSLFYLKSGGFEPILLVKYDYRDEPVYSQGEVRFSIDENKNNLSIKDRYIQYDDFSRLYFATDEFPHSESRLPNTNTLVKFETQKSQVLDDVSYFYTMMILKLKQKILHFDYVSQGAPDPRIERILEEVVRSVSDI